MRKLFVSILVFSTVLLHAQTRTNGQGVTMEATNASSTALPAPAAAPTATDVNGSYPERRISTGVIAPKLISIPQIVVATTDFNSEDLSTQKAVVSFKVDTAGQAHHIQIIKSVNPAVDARVLSAVSAWQFAPGTLDDQPVPMDLNLIVQFQAAR